MHKRGGSSGCWPCPTSHSRLRVIALQGRGQLQIVLSKLTFRAGGAESGPGIGPKHRGIAGSITERTDIEGGCRLAGVMNDINHDDFSTQIMISKFRPSIFIDFHRFSKSMKIDDRKYYCINLIFSSKQQETASPAFRQCPKTQGCHGCLSDRFLCTVFIFAAAILQKYDFYENR